MSVKLDLKEKIEKSKITISKEKILYNEPMEKHTTFKIGGPAECLIRIDNLKDLKEILTFASQNQIQVTILGNGSNLLVLDEGIQGLVLQIKLENIEINEQEGKVEVTLGAGTKMGKLAHILLQNQISGFEELSGIPSTVGGAVYMNAGAHGKEMKDIVKSVVCVDYQGNKKQFTNQDMNFQYRNSCFKTKDYIITEVTLELQKGNSEEIKEKMDKYASYRREKQPIEYPSAGSTFKRGNNFITAQLIDQAGLKGYSVGGAEVSTKHSGFVINKGGATAKDVLQLVEYVKEEVKRKFDKEIELEIEVVGKM